jgi:hemerythrin
MSIVWRDAMNVGDPVIDADHHHLVDLINGFEASVSDHIDHKGIAQVLLGLAQYTGEHFQREEELQLQIHYPFHDSHRHAHRDLLRQLTGLLAEYSQAEKGGRRDRMIRDMAVFLRRWLIDHIIESDLRMKPYIQTFLSDRAEADKRRRAALALSEANGQAETPRLFEDSRLR